MHANLVTACNADQAVVWLLQRTMKGTVQHVRYACTRKCVAQHHLLVKAGTAVKRLLDGLGDVPALLTQTHQVGMQRSLPRRPPQLGDEVPEGYQGGDEGGF